MASEEPLPDRCAATTRSGGYCENYPLEGAERCRMHGGQSPSGPENGNYKHGAFSKHLESDLTEQEREALGDLADALGDPEEAVDLVREQAAEAYLKYKRSGDERFLREYRQLLSTFNIVDAPDQVEVEHSGSIDGERTLELDDATQDAVRDVLRQRREVSDE